MRVDPHGQASDPAPSPRPDASARWVPRPDGREEQGARARIIFADDSEQMRVQVLGLLRNDYEVEVVGDGEEALAAIRREAPDLVLADVMMPGLDGFGLLRALRSDPMTHAIPVILLTGRVDEDSKVEGLESGADDYLVKPFQVRELKARIAAHVKLARLRKGAMGQRIAEEAAALNRAILSSLREHVAVLDGEGVIIAVNEAWCRFAAANCGNGPTGLGIGLNYLAVCRRAAAQQDASASQAVAGIEAVLAGTVPDFELEYPCDSPTEPRWFLMTVMPLKTAGGGAVVGHRDISARKRAEETQARLAAILEATPDLVSSATADGRVIYLNREARRVLGVPEGELGDWLIPRGHPAWANRIVQDQGIPTAIRDGSWVGETAVLGHDGREIPVSQVIIAHRDPGGGTLYLSTIARDITERKRAEKALRVSEGRFRLMADGAPTMIWMAGPDQLCTYCNRAWLEFTGRPLEREVGNGWADGVHPEDRPVCFDIYRRSFDARQPFTVEWRCRRFDGEYRWLLVAGSPRFEADGRFAGYIGSCLDITGRKRAEDALRASEQTLRESRRDLRILAGRLLQAQEEERRRIAREMHDDVSQRLAALAIEAGSLEHLSGRFGRHTRKIRGMREQLVKLAEDVHALSRQLHPSIINDLGLVDALRSECIHFSRREGIAVEFRPVDVPEVLPQEVALCLYRINQEALRNVSKHSRAPSVRVDLCGTLTELILTVADAGIGFEAGLPRPSPGLGLGLASMKERARLIQAELSIQSEPGLGTTLTVRVPLSGSNS